MGDRPMDDGTANQILGECLATYRQQTHAGLAARLDDSSYHHTPVDVIQGTSHNGVGYTIEISILWDDKNRRHIRVMADLTSSNRGCLFGFIPVLKPDVADDFIMAPDGTFIGE
ncbi:MAG: hypothetical protein HKN47_04005 [Pirellulaceae bacterium]|nr:hypothetical protein [Pirellulaceae bacterium]